jgi:energy-coupling factor transport system ATP-binding protein
VENVSFSYAGSEREVLRNLQLTITEGEFVLLAGPSGCGKSTLALALAGLIPSRIAGTFEGRITLGELEVGTMEVSEVAQHIGIVFQNPDNQLVHLDVESEVAFGPENLALPHDEIERRVSESLLYTGMERMRKLEIFALSGGQKQRIAIAATLAMQSRILILDEPTSDLDPVGTQEVLGVLRTLNKQYGWTIVLVEHKIDEVVPWVDRILLMDAGRIILDAPPRNAFNDLTPWQRQRVSIPQIVELACALPDVFQHRIPLTVDEAYEALAGTRYEQSVQQHTRQQEDGQGSGDRNGSGKNILAWEHVSLAYENKTVLRDVNLAVRAQDWLAIVGANGAGKTSLASLAMGFQAPTAGKVLYDGRAVIAGQISRQAEHMAYLFQAADTMLFTATVEQELTFGLRHQRGRRQEKMSYDVEQLLDVIDLSSYRQANPFNLSHGQRKRLAIGTLLARYPRALILDEPTTGQDEGHASAFLQFLQDLRERDKLTYIMITHNMESVARYANRMVVLNDARIVLDGTPAEVFAHMDELASYGILPPSIAQLHTRLSGGQARRVALSVNELVHILQSVEALS